MRNAENRKRSKAPAVVTLWRDYGFAGREKEEKIIFDPQPCALCHGFILTSTFRIPNSPFLFSVICLLFFFPHSEFKILSSVFCPLKPAMRRGHFVLNLIPYTFHLRPFG